MVRPQFSKLSAGYAALWDMMAVRAEAQRAVERMARAIVAGRARYESVAAATGVPWYVVGLIHSLEASLRFDAHLHNGDPLTARTVRVPKGRPRTGTPPFTWEESATDALRGQGLGRVTGWTVERIAYVMEGYNGWGYRRAGIAIPSPYLWSFSNHHTKGKFVRDGVYDPNAISRQAGAMPLLAALAGITGIRLEREGQSNSAALMSLAP